MLIIKGEHLKSSEKKMLHRFCHYVMDHFCAPAVQARATIIIKFIDPRTLKGKDKKDLREFKAWSVYDWVDDTNYRNKHFTIMVSSSTLTSRKRTKKMIRRLKDAMECIGHELVHVKQVMNHESFDYKNGDVRYKGKRYSDWEEGEKYYFSPWELEAYGHEQGLFKVFEAKLKQEEAKAKKP